MTYTVLEAADGAEARRLSERHRGPIDVLITDANMPKVTGPELAESFRAERPETRRILVSGERITAAGMFDATLEKPFSPEDLARVVRAVLASKRAM